MLEIEQHLIKVIGKPFKIVKNMLGGYVAYWNFTNTEVLNLFKKHKNYITIKQFSPYWTIGLIKKNTNISLFQISNRRGYLYHFNVSLDFAEDFKEYLKC